MLQAPHFPISPSPNNPLVLVKTNSRQYLTLHKLWLENTPNGWSQVLRLSTCKIKKLHPTDNLLFSNLNLDKLEWSKPASEVEAPEGTVTPIGVIFPIYSPSSHTLSILSLFKQKFLKTLEGPTGKFLSSLPPLQPHITEYQQRIITNIASSLPTYTGPTEPTNYFSTPNPTQPFPTTIAEAVDAYNAHLDKRTTLTPTVTEPPTLTLCPTQPTQSHPFEIFINNPICHSPILPRHQPPALYRVYILDTPATPTKRFRQVAYAIPVEPNPKNPSAIPFPLCPLKSTVVTLYWDSNPNSPTFGQPIVKSSSEPQPFAPTQPPTPQPIQPVTQQEPSPMSSLNCKFCGNLFPSSGTKTIYCSPKCRIDYNAGKKFGEMAEAKFAKAHKPLKVALPPALTRYGIQFPDGYFYTGAKYENGLPVHNANFRDMPIAAKSYSPAKIQELFSTHPHIFAGCSMVELASLDEMD
jgi:hypothetical protein